MIDVYEHIEDYIKGRLSKEDVLKFESAMSHDTELSMLVENYSDISSVSNGLLELELLDEVRSHSSTSKGWLSKKVLSILVSILLLLGIAYVGYKNGQKSKKEKQQFAYFIKNYERPENTSVLRSSEISELTNLERAKYYYELNDFKKSEEILNGLLNSNSNSADKNEIYFWLGHALVNQKKYKAALSSFEKSNLEGAQKYSKLIRKILEE